MTQGPIISTHILFHGIYSDSLSGNLPYFYLLFCMLTSVTIIHFLLDGIYDVMPV